MQYLLTQEEYDKMITKEQHIKIRNNLLDGLAKANKRILEITGFTCNPVNCSIYPIGLQSGCGTCLSLDKF